MNIFIRQHSSALLLGTLVFLHGCTGSSVTDTKEQDQAEADALAAIQSPRPADDLRTAAPTLAKTALSMGKKKLPAGCRGREHLGPHRYQYRCTRI